MLGPKMKVLQALMEEMGNSEAQKLKPKKMEEESIDPLELMKQTLDSGEPVGIMKKAIIIKKSEPEMSDEEEDMMEGEDSSEEEDDSSPAITMRDIIKKKKGI